MSDELEHKDERLHAATHPDWRDALAAKRAALTDDDPPGDDGPTAPAPRDPT